MKEIAWNQALPNAKPDFKQRLVIRERWESISELNIYMRLLPFPPWADPPPADRVLGSALADPLEAEDPPMAGKTPGFIRLRWNMSFRKRSI